MKPLAKTISLAAAFILVPMILVTIAFSLLKAQPAESATALPPLQWANLPEDPKSLADLRTERRNAGEDVEGLNLRIWAASATHPTALFSVAPPSTNTQWRWSLSQKGDVALAVSAEPSTSGQRTVGLYDLIDRRWRWSRRLSWPEHCDQPVEIPGALLVRYFQNDRAFVMEVSTNGTIQTIERLGRSARPSPVTLRSDSRLPSQPIAYVRELAFTQTTNGTLCGFSTNALPGLSAGISAPAETTTFSGNGRLQFFAQPTNGTLEIADTLTHKRFFKIPVWSPEERLQLQTLSANESGSRVLLTFLRESGRPLSIEVIPAENKINRKAFSDPLPASDPTCGSFADGKWSVRIREEALTFSPSNQSDIIVARLPLSLFGEEPPHILTVLAGERTLHLANSTQHWLIDLGIARHYADVLDNRTRAEKQIPSALVARFQLHEARAKAYQALETTPEEWAALTNGTVLAKLEAAAKPQPAPAYAALETDLLLMNRAWPWALAAMNSVQKQQNRDSRAPKINPFLLFRAALAEQDVKTAFEAYRELRILETYTEAPDEELQMIFLQCRLLFNQSIR